MDRAIFYAIYGLSGGVQLDLVGIFCAVMLIWVEVAALIVFVGANVRNRWLAGVNAFLAGVVAWLMSHVIGLIYFRPRPFVDLPGVHALISKSSADKSFPSDHATIAFAFAVAVFLVNKRWGIPLLIAAAFISLGRIYVGVHYPSDVVAGGILGAGVAVCVHAATHWYFHTRHQPKKSA